jgi:MarR-like DNA-binding transcriptional regulator SgrR of sgrS sRNA
MAGLELFPSFLAADQQIKTKQDENGTLQLIIIYNNDKRTAEKMASRLQQIGKIKSIPIHTVVTQSKAFEHSTVQPAGIFISQKNVHNLNTIVQYGKQHSIITFSPFSKDLQQGVTGSISITARIRPEINMSTLKSSHLTMKPFFLRISTPYSH